MERNTPTNAMVEVFGQSEKLSSAFSSNPNISLLQFPPGLLGWLSQFFMAAAPRPVFEFALAAAIAFLAGITGRAYNVSGTGLNQFIIVTGGTGRGKEAIAGGISKLMKAVAVTSPTIFDFRGPDEIASPQALIKWLARQPCVFSIVGEFGLKLKEMSAERAPPHITGIKRALLDLYHKSGYGSTMGAMAYSDRDKNTAVISSPSFTLIGDSTPEKFFENISEDVVTDGSLPRFMFFSYEGDQQPLNKAHSEILPDNQLLQAVAEAVAHSQKIASLSTVCNVDLSPDAQQFMDEFEVFTRYCVNNRDPLTGLKLPTKPNSVAAELWNRAHLKALKLAALCAVGCNYNHPCVDAGQALWAINLVRSQTLFLIGKFNSGDIGLVQGNEAKQLKSIERVIAEYATSPFEQHQMYGGTEQMHRDRVILSSHIQRRLVNAAPFRGLGGGTRAINERIKQMLEGDEITEIRKDQMQKQYGTTARAFAISNPKFILKALD